MFLLFHFLFFYNETAYHKYSTLLPNLHIYSASPHCLVLKSGLQKPDSCVIHAPPLWTKLPVRTRKSFFRPLNRALHTPPLDPTHVSVSFHCRTALKCHLSPILLPLVSLPTPCRLLSPPSPHHSTNCSNQVNNDLKDAKSSGHFQISPYLTSTVLSIIISHPSALFLESLSSLKFQESTSRIPECPCLGFANSKCWHIPESSPPSLSCLCPYPYSLAVSFTLLLSLSPEDSHFYIYSPDFSSELQTYNQLPTRHRHLDD